MGVYGPLLGGGGDGGAEGGGTGVGGLGEEVGEAFSLGVDGSHCVRVYEGGGLFGVC